MPVDIGPKIGIDGEAEFRKQIQQINTSVKTLGSEMKVVTSEFANNAKSSEALRKQSDVLERTVLTLNEKLEAQQKMLKESADKYGEADERTQKWQQAVNKTQSEINTANAAIESNTKALNGYGNEVSDASQKTLNFGDVLKANLLSKAITAGVEALANGIKKIGGAMKSAITDSAAYADEILTLSTQTGIATDKLQEYRYMADLVDVDVETLTGSMAKLTKNMATATKGKGDAYEAFKALGVAIEGENGALRDNEDVFNDVINALGKMENETQRDAYAMQIFGKSAQDLNPLIAAGSEKLAEFAEEARNTGYVLSDETISSLVGVQDSLDRFKLLTENIKNQLGSALAPTLTDLAERLNAWVQSADWDAIGERITNIVTGISEFVAKVTENGETIISIIAGIAAGFATWNVVSLVLSIVESLKAFKAATEGASIAQAALNAVMAANPIGIVITILAAVVAAIAAFVLTNDEAKAKLKVIWDGIVNVFRSAWEAVKAAFASVGQFFDDLWNVKIKGTFRDAVSSFASIGRAIVDGVWQGIQNSWSTFYANVRSFFQNIIASVKSVLGIHSPSRVFAGIGENMALGLDEGFADEMKSVQKNINKQMGALPPMSIAAAGTTGAVYNSGVSSAVNSAVSAAAVYLDKTKVGRIIIGDIANKTRAYGVNPAL